MIDYECESLLSNGKTRDFLVDPQVNKAKAGAGIKNLEAVKHDRKITAYEATIIKNGKKISLELKPDGTSSK